MGSASGFLLSVSMGEDAANTSLGSMGTRDTARQSAWSEVIAGNDQRGTAWMSGELTLRCFNR